MGSPSGSGKKDGGPQSNNPHAYYPSCLRQVSAPGRSRGLVIAGRFLVQSEGHTYSWVVFENIRQKVCKHTCGNSCKSICKNISENRKRSDDYHIFVDVEKGKFCYFLEFLRFAFLRLNPSISCRMGHKS